MSVKWTPKSRRLMDSERIQSKPIQDPKWMQICEKLIPSRPKATPASPLVCSELYMYELGMGIWFQPFSRYKTTYIVRSWEWPQMQLSK